MYLLITYDVNTTTPAGAKRLRNVAKLCLNHGQRVQNSVFECCISETDLVNLTAQLEVLIDTKQDSIRIYSLGQNWRSKIKTLGRQSAFDFEGNLFV